MTVEEKKNDVQSVPKEYNSAELEYSDLYPGRKATPPSRTWVDKLLFVEKRKEIDKFKCETNAYECLTNSPIVKLMLAALKSSGCEIDIGRHISCEICDESVTGGYDPVLNQIVICQNTARSKNRIQSVLTHEMIHMFDYCRNKLDLNNLDHLACTEIRAANLCHCSFLSAFTQGTASFRHIKKAHQDCVIDRATRSVVAVRNIPKDTATEVVMRVFNKCYNDLEPIGRRMRRRSNDMKKAYFEASLYGYLD